MVTPLDKRGEVDQLATEAVVKRLIEAGVDGTRPWVASANSRILPTTTRRTDFPAMRGLALPAPEEVREGDRGYAPWGTPAGSAGDPLETD